MEKSIRELMPHFTVNDRDGGVTAGRSLPLSSFLFAKRSLESFDVCKTERPGGDGGGGRPAGAREARTAVCPAPREELVALKENSYTFYI